MTKNVSIGCCKLATLIFLALFGGCAVGPDYKRPEATTIPPTYATSTEGWKIAQPAGQLPKGNWWEIFGDAELNHLETQSIAANQQLKVAFAQFAESRAQLNIARAEFFPSVDFAGSGVRQRISPNQPSVLSGTPIGKSSTFNNFLAPFELSYEVAPLNSRGHRPRPAKMTLEGSSYRSKPKLLKTISRYELWMSKLRSFIPISMCSRKPWN
jgi:outer membrane protein TolC